MQEEVDRRTERPSNTCERSWTEKNPSQRAASKPPVCVCVRVLLCCRPIHSDRWWSTSILRYQWAHQPGGSHTTQNSEGGSQKGRSVLFFFSTHLLPPWLPKFITRLFGQYLCRKHRVQPSLPFPRRLSSGILCAREGFAFHPPPLHHPKRNPRSCTRSFTENQTYTIYL